ncbi:hypothetical protein [Nonomuraea aurantiaca]|uniref:hypothetical protein n=1 Tax=Nonomuraea aurantiaca TaxID=2878562 RepID=UPI003FD875DC
MTRPRIAVSSCLLGEPVRFNGGHSHDRFLAETLDAHVEWVPGGRRRAATLDVDGYVFKARSPRRGSQEAHPLLPVEDEERLHDALLREAFVERVFAHARLREFLCRSASPRPCCATTRPAVTRGTCASRATSRPTPTRCARATTSPPDQRMRMHGSPSLIKR